MPVDQYRPVEGVSTDHVVRRLKYTLPDSLEEFNKSLHIYKLVSKRRTTARLDLGNYFEDGIREIDFILVYDMTLNNKFKDKVNTFLANAELQGLQFESAMGKELETRKLLFIKAHCPEDVLVRSAIAFNIEFESGSKNQQLKRLVNMNRMLHCNRFHTKLTKRQVSAETSTISTAERIMTIYEILKTVKYGENFSEFSVESLVKRKYLVAAYPLHDGPVEWGRGPITDRQLLAKYWAKFNNWFKLQPMDHIYRYFGPETAFYFKLCGHYNQVLTVAAALGFLSILFGILFCQHEYNHYLEVCSSDIIMCPNCYFEHLCHYFRLSRECTRAALTYIFNNFLTFIYGIFMCFWAVYFLIKWIRREGLLRFQWNLLHIEKDLQYRWEYAERTKIQRWSRITGKSEPFVPITIRVLRILFSILIVMLLFLLICITVIITIVVRQTTKYILTPVRMNVEDIRNYNDPFFKTGFAYMVSVCLMILLETLLFTPITIKLTDFENPRTQDQYERSLILKQYLLYSFNAYSHVFYTAFVKGRFFIHPAAIMPDAVDIFNTDMCGPLGCMLFLNFQIFILLFFRFFVSLLVRYIIPIMKYRKKMKKLKDRIWQMTAWELGYFMQPTDRYFLLREHREFIIRHGYTTLFAIAFPLGPLFALLANSLFLRLDAYMLCYVKRRPVPVQREGIHYWNGVLLNLTYLGVITNSFLIAFDSDLIPFLTHPKQEDSSTLFLSHTLSQFNVEDYQPGLDQLYLSATNSCMYHGQRYSPGHPYQYQLTGFYWHERFCRFLAVLIIEVCCIIFALFVAAIVPQLPSYIKEFIYEKSRRLSDQQHDHAGKVIAKG